MNGILRNMPANVGAGKNDASSPATIGKAKGRNRVRLGGLAQRASYLITGEIDA
jgi:hypothetical protein